MSLYVGITDQGWFERLAGLGEMAEVNFWRPGGSAQFRALAPGELFLFKLHAPLNFIVGGGFFAHSSLVPISLAWEAFGEANGVAQLSALQQKIWALRKPEDRGRDVQIGCTLLSSPFFWPRDRWLSAPSDWKGAIQAGKTYDTTSGVGAGLRQAVEARLRAPPAGPLVGRDSADRYGAPMLVTPRLGQGTFRIAVTDAYERRCVITGERTLPVLEAAHIRPYASGGQHDIANGLLLRSDLHTLFDRGYVTVTPERRFEVSRRIREEFSNGKDYYRLHGQEVRAPMRGFAAPDATALEWHNSQVFLGS